MDRRSVNSKVFSGVPRAALPLAARADADAARKRASVSPFVDSTACMNLRRVRTGSQQQGCPWHTLRSFGHVNARPRGLTLLEVIIAMFIFLIGILSIMLAIPSGINAASLVVFQDASIHLAQSKFSEFRRDRADPAVDLLGGPYMGGAGTLANGRPAGLQEPLNGNPGEWRDFAHSKGDTYEYFDDIERYEWKIDKTLAVPVGISALNAQNLKTPLAGAGTPVGLTQITLVIHLKSTDREFRFTQYMCAYE
jgi:type II secretory pathway pseudopilin PulG